MVETTNFNGKNPFRGASENIRVTERFTRVADDRDRLPIHRRRSGHLGEALDAPRSPMQKTVGPIFEFACHETNYGIANILAGARADEKRAAEGAARKGSE